MYENNHQCDWKNEMPRKFTIAILSSTSAFCLPNLWQRASIINFGLYDKMEVSTTHSLQVLFWINITADVILGKSCKIIYVRIRFVTSVCSCHRKYITYNYTKVLCQWDNLFPQWLRIFWVFLLLFYHVTAYLNVFWGKEYISITMKLILFLK